MLYNIYIAPSSHLQMKSKSLALMTTHMKCNKELWVKSLASTEISMKHEVFNLITPKIFLQFSSTTTWCLLRRITYEKLIIKVILSQRVSRSGLKKSKINIIFKDTKTCENYWRISIAKIGATFYTSYQIATNTYV